MSGSGLEGLGPRGDGLGFPSGSGLEGSGLVGIRLRFRLRLT
jgi:hypothetical protein